MKKERELMPREDSITVRQREVRRLWDSGMNAKAIAEEMQAKQFIIERDIAAIVQDDARLAEWKKNAGSA